MGHFDMFIKVDSIKGESADDAHKEEIDVLSWSWGMSQSATTHHGSGGGGGKVAVRDVSFTKRVDKATPLLMKFCCSGQHIKNASLVVRKAGGKKPVEYIKLTMEDVIVAHVSSGGSGGSEILTEEITLNFARVKCDYTPQKADGSPAPVLSMGWDIAANKEHA